MLYLSHLEDLLDIIFFRQRGIITSLIRDYPLPRLLVDKITVKVSMPKRPHLDIPTCPTHLVRCVRSEP